MIKFGWRDSLLYPSLFILFIFIRRIVKLILEILYPDIKLSYLMITFVFVFELIVASLLLWNQNRKNKSVVKPKFLGISLIKQESLLDRPDSNFKIIVLIIFSSYFSITGALSRRNVSSGNNNIYDEFHAKFRSIEIILSSIICYFTFKNKIYKHHKFALIIIFICLIIVVAFGVLLESNKSIFFLNFFYTISSSFCRVFLDIVEKYLYDVDFLDIYKVMIFESIVDLIISFNYFWLEVPRREITTILTINDGLKLFYIIGFLMLYTFFSGIKNVYRRFTVKKFTPMTRALAESILDPIFIIIGYLTTTKKEQFDTIYFIITLICSLIMVFNSCVYNELFVLYCCDLEKNTHLAIEKQNNNESSLELSKNYEYNGEEDEDEE